MEALDVVGVEDGGHRHNRLEVVRDRLNLFAPVQHAAFHRGLVGVVRDRVPSAEDELVELREGNEVSYERRLVVGALAEPNRGHLGDRPDGLSCAAPYVLDTRDERRRDSPKTNEKDAKLALRRRYAGRGRRYEVPGFEAYPALAGGLQQRCVPLGGYPPGLGPVLHRALALAQ